MLIEKLVLGRKKGSASIIKEKKEKVMEGALPKVKTRKVKLAWQHYNKVTQRYVMVRERERAQEEDNERCLYQSLLIFLKF